MSSASRVALLTNSGTPRDVFCLQNATAGAQKLTIQRFLAEKLLPEVTFLSFLVVCQCLSVCLVVFGPLVVETSMNSPVILTMHIIHMWANGRGEHKHRTPTAAAHTKAADPLRWRQTAAELAQQALSCKGMAQLGRRAYCPARNLFRA